MTCPDARDQLSSLLDDALDGAARQTLERHLAACADCRRELEQLRATVTLLGRLPAPHAPAGFVDHVMAATHRPPWPRRVLDALFVPLRVKLPLEAAAVLFVGVSALYVYQRTPEVRDLARQETPAPAPASPMAPGPPSPPSDATSAETELAARSTSPAARAPEAPRGSGDPARAREQARAAPPAPASTPTPDRRDVRPAPPVPPMAPRPNLPATQPTPMAEPMVPAATPTMPPASPTAPPAPPPASPAKPAEPLAKTAEPQLTPAEQPAEKKEGLAAGRSDAAAPGSSSTGSEQRAKSVEAPAQRDAAGAGPRLPPSAARSTPPSVAPPVAEPRGGAVGALPAAPPAARSESAPARAPVARRLVRAVDASGRLVVPAREPAETALDALLGRLGARRVERRLEGDRGMVLIDVLVPGARYRELIEGLGQIGRWTTEHEPRTLPAQLRVEVALTVEP